MSVKNKLKLTVTSRSSIAQLFKNALPCLKTGGLKILKIPTDKQGKILLIVSAKAGNAVARNLFKRRVKSIYRESALYNLPYDFIIIANKTALAQSFSDLQSIFLSLPSAITL